MEENKNLEENKNNDIEEKNKKENTENENNLENKEPKKEKKVKKEKNNEFDDDFQNNDFNSQKPKGEGNFGFKSIVLLLFIVVLLISLPNMFSKTDSMNETIVSYSRFADLIDKGVIKEVSEKGAFIQAKYTTDNNKTMVFKTRMISDRLANDVDLMQKIRAKNVEVTSVEPERMSFLLMTIIQWFPMLLLIGIWLYMLSQMNKGPGGSGGNIFNVGKSKAKTAGNEIKITFEDVAGAKEAKEELAEVVSFLKDQTKYLKLGAKIPKGVLLLGSPGTGKTLLAKAVAGEAGVPFFSISGSEFVEMFVGVGASRVRDLFNKARKNSPCIIFIDEIDAVGRKRGAGHGGGNDEREQTLNQLLVEMDGFGTDVNIIIIAATNRPDVLDQALLRPGRFDRQVVVDAPDLTGREEILKVHARGKTFAKDVDFNIIARKTPGFVGADLANLLNEAAILAGRENKEEIEMKHILEASEKVAIGPERKSRIMPDKEKKLTAYHEVGHALIAWLLPDTDPVHKVTIIPRGTALGLTWQLPTEDKFTTSKKDLMNQIKILLGGRAAEEIVFGDITNGAASDIDRATKIAYNMITKWGMSDKLGPLAILHFESDLMSSRAYSDVTSREVDQEIHMFINDSYNEVKRMLIENRMLLNKVSEELLVRETISGEEMVDIITKEKEVKIAEA